jgi:hypothetical protein
LNERLASSAYQAQKEGQKAPDDPVPLGGLHSFMARYFTERRVVRAQLTGGEFRLSDLLNDSAEVVQIQMTMP